MDEDQKEQELTKNDQSFFKNLITILFIKVQFLVVYIFNFFPPQIISKI